MNDMGKCIMCGSVLNSALIKAKCKRCDNCRHQTHLDIILSPINLDSNFSKKWASSLMIKYYGYLKEIGIKISGIRKNVNSVRKLLIFAENDFLSPHEINADWLQKKCEEGSEGLKQVKISFLCFLEEQGILKMPSVDDLMQISILKQIERFPKEFRRLVEIHCKTRLELRKRQIDNNETIPLSLRTIISDIEIFSRFARWIIKEHSEVSSWELVQENHIHEFLLTLKPNNREIARKDLHVLFKLAKRKKLITYIPMVDYPYRELPSVMEPLNMAEQRRVAKVLLQSMHANPLGCILGCLCFFHGLSTKHIQSIKLSDVDLSGKKIYVKDRPPVYLSTEEMLALGNYIAIRSHMRNNKKREYLIIGDLGAKVYLNRPLTNSTILRKVKELTGYTVKQLRVTCYHSFSAKFGPLMLIDTFGLSRTQASRYGRFEEYLLEEEIKAQRDRESCTYL